MIRDFILRCLERQLTLHTSQAVYDQAKNWRQLFREEFLRMGIGFYATERMLQASEKKFKEFVGDRKKIEFHAALPRDKYDDVKTFFRKHEANPGMIALAKQKSVHKNRVVDVQPEESDIIIFSEALSLPNLYFTTTDGHFKGLTSELEKEFK